MYSSIAAIPESYAFETGSMIEWNEKSAFWVFNLVSNWVYTRYDLMHPEVEKYQEELESGFIAQIPEIDKNAEELLKTDRQKAIDYLTQYSVNTGNKLVADWQVFFQYLFMKYVDGNMKISEGHTLPENGFGRGVPKEVTHPGYGPEWLRLMMLNTGDRYVSPKMSH
jgi:dipeptidase